MAFHPIAAPLPVYMALDTLMAMSLEELVQEAKTLFPAEALEIMPGEPPVWLRELMISGFVHHVYLKMGERIAETAELSEYNNLSIPQLEHLLRARDLSCKGERWEICLRLLFAIKEEHEQQERFAARKQYEYMTDNGLVWVLRKRHLMPTDEMPNRECLILALQEDDMVDSGIAV